MRKGWFGPKQMGWGASPSSWEGWLVTLLMIGGLAVSIRLFVRPLHEATGLAIPVLTPLMGGAWVLALLAIVALTYKDPSKS